MSRFYVKPESVKDTRIYVEKEESHHIIDVMRLSEGDRIVVFDGTGREYAGEIESIANKRVVINILERRSSKKKHPVSISLAQAVPKRDKMDLIVQKTTELGVDEIIPVETARTIVRLKGKRRDFKIGRWEKIAVEASKQSGRADLPEIKEITPFEKIIESIDRFDIAIIPCLSEKAISIKSALEKAKRPKRALVIIGPEGGFSDDEIRRAAEKGALPVTLGPLVLKSDTAAIAAVSILNHEFSSR